MASKIKVTESRDLGYWFGIDGVAIKNQPQLDLAVISLASLYGLEIISERKFKEIHTYIYSHDSEETMDEGLVNALIALAEVCTQYLNQSVERGYKFEFTGADYSKLELVKVA